MPMPQMPKGSTKCLIVNPNARDYQNYSIIEDLAQIPYAMLVLEVFHSCLAKRSEFLTMIRVVDLKNCLVITFDMSSAKKILPHHMDFHIKSTFRKMNIFQTILDEGISTCFMLISCWKALRSLVVVPSPTIITAFNGYSHRPN